MYHTRYLHLEYRRKSVGRDSSSKSALNKTVNNGQAKKLPVGAPYL